MGECVWYWRVSAVLAGAGVAITALSFRPGEPRLLLGLTLCILGVVVANMGCVARRGRSLDEEFEAGFRAGYRQGRRVPSLHNVTPMRGKAVADGRVQKAPLGDVAGHGSAARRPTSHAH